MTAGKMITLTVIGEGPPLTRVAPKLTKKIKVGQVQLNTSFSGQHYLPLAAGMLQAYAQKHIAHPEDYEFKPAIFKFMRVEEASEMLSDCDAIGISNYGWGEQRSLAIAKDYKRRRPSGLVIFGGPQNPDSKKQFRRNKTADLNDQEKQRKRINFTENYHRAHPEIDICVHGEGERVFTIILERMAIDGCYDKSSIPSASYLDINGSFHYNNKLGRMNDKELSETPSPFTTGVFNALMNAYPDQKWILMYETNRGCPYTCTYCDWGGATEDRVSRFLMEQIYADFIWAGEHKIPYFFLCDANFGILQRDVQIAEYLAEVKAKYNCPEGVSTQNAKNPKKHTIQALKILEKAGLNKATVMSQQTLNQESLIEVRRENMDLSEYDQIQKDLAKEGIYTMTDYIIPLPKEYLNTLINGISTLIENGQHNRIQFNNLSVLVNTEMGDPEYQEKNGFVIVTLGIINGHGKKNDDFGDGIRELQQLVVGTSTMPPADWRKARALCWMVNLIYFNKLLQVPIITLREVYGIPYKDIFKFFAEYPGQSNDLPVFKEVYDFFEKTAHDMQNGTQEEFIYSQEWLDIWWPVEEYAFIKLCRENKLEQFYHEAELMMMHFMTSDKPTKPLLDAIALNKSLLKLPFQTNDLELDLTYNVWDLYKSVLLGQIISIQQGTYHYTIDRTSEGWDSWEDWYQKMVWFGNRQGAYLYGNKNPHGEIAGHH